MGPGDRRALSVPELAVLQRDEPVRHPLENCAPYRPVRTGDSVQGDWVSEAALNEYGAFILGQNATTSRIGTQRQLT